MRNMQSQRYVRKNCGWRIHASFFRKSTTFQIKTLKGESHTCPRVYKNKSPDANYLAEKFMKNFIDDPNMTMKAFKKLVKRKVKVYANRMQLYRAKRKALKSIYGEEEEQYHRLRDYCHMIMEKNQGSVAFVSVLSPPVVEKTAFERIKLCIVLKKDGFLSGCRPIIRIECFFFLKGTLGGQLMVALARDVSNKMIPLAIAVVEYENKDSWSWFLKALVNQLGIRFISDRQKGLIESFEAIVPGVEHRFCVRHLYANCKLRFKDMRLNDLMWGAALSYLEDGFREKNE